MKIHNLDIRVYYEDTDAGGVVYYANYLKFAERARTEFLRKLGLNQSELSEKDGILFVVRKVEMDLLKSAKLDDLLQVTTKMGDISGASFAMDQVIARGDEIIASLKVIIAVIDKNFRPVRIPRHIRELLTVPAYDRG